MKQITPKKQIAFPSSGYCGSKAWVPKSIFSFSPVPPSLMSCLARHPSEALKHSLCPYSLHPCPPVHIYATLILRKFSLYEKLSCVLLPPFIFNVCSSVIILYSKISLISYLNLVASLGTLK